MNASAAAVMAEAGKAINDTFHKNIAIVKAQSGKCTTGMMVKNLWPHRSIFQEVV
eukprot:SAG31_NODE_5898_length_2267_cov_1.315959_1_plen_55_part_00